jgi:hypothetical protein
VTERAAGGGAGGWVGFPAAAGRVFDGFGQRCPAFIRGRREALILHCVPTILRKYI